MKTEIALRPGETFSLPLQGRGSSGYSWCYTVSGDHAAVELRIEGQGEPLHLSANKPDAGSVQEKLVVKAVSPGSVNIVLRQRRSWERDRPPLAEQTVVVNVQAE
jgi:predicted secreted protein